MSSKVRNWINFARYSSPPIGKGRVIDCELSEDGTRLHMIMQLDGVTYLGTLNELGADGEEE